MEIPSGLLYTKDHEWALHDGSGTVTVGITSHAQESLGEVVYVELPQVGRELKEHETFGVVESIKAVSDLYCPAQGKVLEVNPAVAADPSLINKSAYDQGWLIKVKMSDKGALAGLMSAAQYKQYVETLK